MHHLRRAALICVLLAMAACSHATQSAPRAHRGAAPQRRAPTPAPTPATPSPAPAATQMPPRALPPAIVRHVVRLPPDAAPKILAVAMSETTIHHGDRVSGSVVTTSNVASVQARVGGYAMTLNKIGVGRFALSYTANLPWFVRGNFALYVIATNTNGATAERVIPLTVP